MNATIRITVLLFLMLSNNTKTLSQSCTDSFTDTSAAITCSPYQTAFLNNGNMVVANYHGNNGSQQLTVDLFNVAQCKWTKSYTCPDVSGPDFKLQLLVANNDFIYIKYTGNSYSNLIQLNKNLIEQQRFQPNKNGYPEMQIALDKTGNCIVVRKKVNTSFNFDVQFQKLAQNNFNNLSYTSSTNIPNISINTIDDITTDKNNNYIVTGQAQELSTGKVVLYVTEFGRSGGINFFSILNWPASPNSASKVITDSGNNILVAANMLHTKNVSVIFKLNAQGVQQWAVENKVDAFAENNFWMACDSNKSTFIIYNEVTGNAFPASVAVLVKYLANGQKAWQRNYKYVNAKSIVVKDASSLFIGGSKYLTQQDFPSYRPYWQLINLAGDEIENAHDYFNVDSNSTLSYQGQFNQLVYNHNFKTLATIGTRIQTLLDSSFTHYAFARSYDFNAVPKLRFENSASFQITPNPAIDIITINSKQNDMILHATITTIDGKIVFEKAISDVENSIAINDWNPGIYFVKLITQHGQETTKFVKL